MHSIDDLDTWQDTLRASRIQPVVLFKHSTACNISAYVLDSFRSFVSERQSVDGRLVDVIRNRGLSDEISARLLVVHETPQVIAIANEQPIWHRSHWAIDFEELDSELVAFDRP